MYRLVLQSTPYDTQCVLATQEACMIGRTIV